MTKDNRDVIEVLKFELQFLEQGGYGRSVRTPWKATSIFQDSPTCLNFNDVERPHPCSECLLIDFVPPADRQQEVPCHHIPIGPKGEPVAVMERRYSDIEKEEAVKNWLRATISRLEHDQQQQ